MAKEKIKIAIIDSGINDSNFMSGHEIVHVNNHNFSSNYDYLNHGTTCTSIIVNRVEECIIYNLKVFDKKIVASSKNILDAIEWCLNNDNDIDIINLSLSITDLNCYYEFKTICDMASNNSCVIIAAADNLGEVCFPAYLKNVIGVGIANIEENDIMYSNNGSIHVYANGSYKNSPHYTSFATAKVTSLVANILINSPQNRNHLFEILKKKSIEYNYDSLICHNKDFDFTLNTENIFKEEKDNIVSMLQGVDISFVGTYNEVFLLEKYKDLLKVFIKRSDYIERSLGNDSFLGRVSLPKFSLPHNYEPSTSNVLLGNVTPNVIHDFTQKFPNQSLYTLYPTKFGSRESIKSITHKTLFGINDLTDIPDKHIFKNTIPTIALLNLSSFPNLLALELEILEITNLNDISVKMVSNSDLSPLWGMDYLSNAILPLESSSLYIKGLVEYYNNEINKGIVMSIAVPSVSHKKVKLPDFEQQFLYYTASLLAFQPDYTYVIIDEFTDILSLSNLLMNLKSIATTQVLGIVALELNTLSNMNFYFSEGERKKILDGETFSIKIEKMKKNIYDHDIKLNIIEYHEEVHKKHFCKNFKNLFGTLCNN